MGPTRAIARRTSAEPPRFVEPQLALLVKTPPSGNGWAHEIKFDGYRLHARISHNTQLLTRQGFDWTYRYPGTADALNELPTRSAYIDGEIVALRADGTTSFDDLQAAMDNKSTDQLVYFAFDLLFLDGKDLRYEPLRERKRLLEKLLRHAPSSIRYTEHVVGNGSDFLEAARRLGVEGMVSKAVDAPYKPNERGTWRKCKLLHLQEFVVVGFTAPRGSRQHFGSLLLGFYDRAGRLRYAGRGGAGISDRELKRLYKRMTPLLTETMPLAEPPRTSGRFGTPLELEEIRWVKPELVVAVTFLAWTREGLLRQVRYHGLREDKAPGSVVLERPADDDGAAAAVDTRRVAKANVQRLLPDAVAPSKDALRAYWQSVAAAALPYLGRRPLVLVRHVGQAIFFHQRKLPPIPPAVHHITIEKREGGEGTRVWVDSLEGLLGLVDMDVVEIHPWGATVDDIERPDLLVFDLDPGKGIAWSFVSETALALRDELKRGGYDPWCKTSGGKGLHVMVPIEPEWSWDEARQAAKQFVEHFARRDRRYTLRSDLALRAGRLFIDYLRNGRGTTAVGAYSPRARPGCPVSYPLSWKEVARGVKPDAFHMADLARREARTASRSARMHRSDRST
jgi:bifunctional non-homologous end joining protein LigD